MDFQWILFSPFEVRLKQFDNGLKQKHTHTQAHSLNTPHA